MKKQVCYLLMTLAQVLSVAVYGQNFATKEDRHAWLAKIRSLGGGSVSSPQFPALKLWNNSDQLIEFLKTGNSKLET